MPWFSSESLPIAGAYRVCATPQADPRGQFMRYFCDAELSGVLQGDVVHQVNWSRTARLGAVRGLHYQYAPSAEAKLVRCMRGAVFDVIVDLRRGSSTFLKWCSVQLEAESHTMVFIPKGCAHGFQVLVDDTELLYLHTGYYDPEHEAGVRYDEPRLGITWPRAVTDLSDRDQSYAPLAPDFEGIEA